MVLAAPAGATADAAQSVADAYTQATGLRVGVVTFPGDSYGDRVSAALLAGTEEFDLVYLSAESLPKWVDYNMIRSLHLWPEVGENNSAWVKLMEVTRGEGSATYGVPVDPDVDVLWYRGDLLEAAGIPVPGDWEALTTAVEALDLEPGTWPMAVSAGDLDAGRDLAALLGHVGFIRFILGSNSGDWHVDQGALADALERYAGWLADAHLVNPGSGDWSRSDVQNALATGQAAVGMLPLSAASVLLDCERSPDVCRDGEPLLAFAPLPGMEKTLGVGSVNAWAVPLKAPHADAAQEFARWLVTEDGARAWANGGGLPAHRAVLAELGSPAEQALSQVWYFQPAFPRLIPAGDIWRALHIAGHGVSEGEPPELLLEEMVQSIETALRQSGYTVIE